jgi:hypothetical protein
VNAPPLRVDLRVARGPQAQQRALDDWLDARRARADESPAAVVVEGASLALHAPAAVPLLRLTAGCGCCIGLLPLKVGLTRLLRAHRPQSLLLLRASEEHQDRLIALLRGGELGIGFCVDTKGENNDGRTEGSS